MAKKKVTKYDRIPTGLATGPGVTRQSFKAECDINNIMRRFDKEGVITHLNHVKAHYADVCDVPSYRESLNRVNAVRVIFDDLPAILRADFDNDPAIFLDAVNAATDDELLEWGLMSEKEHKARVKATRELRAAEKASRVAEVHEEAQKASEGLTEASAGSEDAG
jgi:phage internal scaffolding protein